MKDRDFEMLALTLLPKAWGTVRGGAIRGGIMLYCSALP